MLIIIDSNVFIFGIKERDSEARELLDRLPALNIAIPRVVLHEVTRNLTTAQVKQLYMRLRRSPNAVISDEIVPMTLVQKYVRMGFNLKGDAYIAAFAEWVNAMYVISENRHFLRGTGEMSFQVVTAAEFLETLEPKDDID